MNNDKIKAFIQQHKNDIISDVKALCDIPSVQAQAQNGAPFGKNVALALDKALEIAQRLGLSGKNCEGYMGYVDVKGESEKQIATIAHLDVVPEGNGWTASPFDMQVRDGWLIGRGVADDKGPAILTLYMAKYFKEQGERLPYTLRVLLGTNEETGMADVEYYLKNYPMPEFCLTPDGAYPVCHGEKGIASGNLVSEQMRGGIITHLSGGVASNVVPDRAYAIVNANADKLDCTENVKVSITNGAVRLDANGIGGHAAMPDGTINAIGVLINYILDNNLCSDAERCFLQLLCELHGDNHGAGVGIDANDGIFTPLTCIGGMISLENSVITQNINIRYPSNTNYDKINAALNKKAQKANASYQPLGNVAPLLISADSDIIKALAGTYNELTGKNEKPFTMGGGTYARDFKSAVAFGIEDNSIALPAFAGPMHGANEGYPIDLLLKSLEIYIVAIEKLMQLKF